MAVGAYAAYNLELRVPGMPLLASFVLGGLRRGGGRASCSACPACGCAASISPSPRWQPSSSCSGCFTKFGWFSNYSASGVISAPPLHIGRLDLNTPVGRYLLVLSIVTVLTIVAIRLVALAARPQLHRRARQRGRGPGHRRAGAAGEAAGLHDQLVLRRRRRRLVGFRLPAHDRAARLRPVALVPDPVHDHHRRHRQHSRRRSLVPPSSA